MKKRYMAWLVVGALLAGSALSGCGTSGDGTASTNEPVTTQAESSAKAEEADSGIPNDSSGWEGFLGSMFAEKASIEETVLVDQDGIKITARSLSYDNYSPTLKLLIENNTDKELSFVSGSVGYDCNSVNGYMVSSMYMNENVTPGNSSNVDVTINADELAALGIAELADIEIGFQINDTDYNEVLTTGAIDIPTTGKDSYDYTTDTYQQMLDQGYLGNAYDADVTYISKDVLYDKSDVRLLSEAFIYNQDGDPILMLEYENASDRQLNICTSNIAVNGIVLTSGTWKSDTVNPGKRVITSMDISDMAESGSLETLGITDIQDITFDVEVKDMDYESLYPVETLTVQVAEGGQTSSDSGEEVYNENGVRIISKGKTEDDYGDDVHLLFLVENNSDQEVYVEDDYDSLSVNGFMVTYILSGQEIPIGKSALLDVDVWSNDLEDNDISGINDISNAEITFEIRDDEYNEIGSATVHVEY